MIKRILGIGLPIGVAIFAESSIFAVIALLLGSLGATVVSGHQIALNVSSLVFMIPYSLSMAVTVRVGQALGRGEPRKLASPPASAWAPPWRTRVLFLQLDAAVSRADCSDLHPDPVVIHLASMLIVFSALFQFSDSIQVTAAGARGPGDHGTDPTLLGRGLAGGLRPGPDQLAR